MKPVRQAPTPTAHVRGAAVTAIAAAEGARRQAMF